MSWLELTVRVSRENASLVEKLLENQPVLALTLTDNADNPVLEPGVGETPLWPSVCVTALFNGETPVEPLARMLSLVPGVDRPHQVAFRNFEDQQWERVWLDRFKPMLFGRGLWIVPGDQAAPPEASHVLRLDPGLAFGTGTHPTTRLCLQWMDGHDFNGQSVIDYGCGSGVLGITAAIKGAVRVTCVDNDPQALLATRDNAGRNSSLEVMQVLMPEQFTVAQTDTEQADTRGADVVLANILAGPLVELAPVLMNLLRPGGTIVLSGILEEQAGEVMAAYRSQIPHITMAIDDGWVRLHGRKAGDDISGRG